MACLCQSFTVVSGSFATSTSKLLLDMLRISEAATTTACVVQVYSTTKSQLGHKAVFVPLLACVCFIHLASAQDGPSSASAPDAPSQAPQAHLNLTTLELLHNQSEALMNVPHTLPLLGVPAGAPVSAVQAPSDSQLVIPVSAPAGSAAIESAAPTYQANSAVEQSNCEETCSQYSARVMGSYRDHCQ